MGGAVNDARAERALGALRDVLAIGSKLWQKMESCEFWAGLSQGETVLPADDASMKGKRTSFNSNDGD